MIVVSLDPLELRDGDLWIDGERIAEPGDGERLDCDGVLVLPGNVNAHTHLYSALARGMPYRLAPPRSFLELLQRVWWRLDRALDEASIHASALVGGMEALLAGTTTVVDHHASPRAIDGSLDVIAEALQSLGLRSALCYETSDRDGPETAQAGLAENGRFLARVARDQPPLTRAMAGAHACFTLSDETLVACAELGPLHIHAAEDAIDEGAVKRLADLDLLDDTVLLAHGVHLCRGSRALVRESGATVAHNARSNMANAVGRAQVAELGERVALGTDGIGSDVFEESRAAYLRLREEGAGATSWPLERVSQGARLAGRLFDEPQLGTLVPGAPADLAVLDYTPPAPLDAESFAGHWLFGLCARWVRDVMVAGEWVVHDRRLVLADEAELAASAAQEAARLWARVDEIPPHGFGGL